MIKRNIFSIIIALIILYLSLASSNSFDKIPLINIPHFDKVVHFGMYLVLMSALLFENRRTIRSFRSLMIFAVISFAYGILMEILQSFTVSRSGNFADAMADFAGIVFSILLWQLFKPIIYRSDNY